MIMILDTLRKAWMWVNPKWHRQALRNVYTATETGVGKHVTVSIAWLWTHEDSGDTRLSFGGSITTFYSDAEWDIRTREEDGTTLFMFLGGYTYPKEWVKDKHGN